MVELNQPIDRKIECPNCKMHNCYEAQYMDVTEYLCFNCGYTSNSKMVKDSEYVKQNFELNVNVPEFTKAACIIDTERNLVWYPGVLIFPGVGIVFPEPNNDDWGWTYASETPVLEDEKEKFKIQGTDEYYKSKIDLDNALRFDKYDFYSAAIAIGAIKPPSNEIN